MSSTLAKNTVNWSFMVELLHYVFQNIISSGVLVLQIDILHLENVSFSVLFGASFSSLIEYAAFSLYHRWY